MSDLHPGSTKYSDKDSGGMLVWSPYHTILDSKRKSSSPSSSLSCLLSYLGLCQTSAFISVVDEYIAIAKEKHGYNVEQVGHGRNLRTSEPQTLSRIFKS